MEYFHNCVCIHIIWNSVREKEAVDMNEYPLTIIHKKVMLYFKEQNNITNLSKKIKVITSQKFSKLISADNTLILKNRLIEQKV